MKKVITYGTFDLFHEGHYNILKRAKELGDYLIVGITTENYDSTRGKLNVKDSVIERIENVKKSGLADEIIIEEFTGQKVQDILKHEVDIFAIGSDWIGKFDYLKEYCEVVYLERTKGISSTQLRNKENSILKIGIVGSGRIANRFIPESKYVSGIEVEGVFSRNIDNAKSFCQQHDLAFYTDEYDYLLEKVDSVYIATPHLSHYEYIKKALINGKHVLCEKPMVLNKNEAEDLFRIAEDNNVVLLEAIKTAFSPGFLRLISFAKSGIIGDIKCVEATFTKLEKENTREFDKNQAGGSVNELATYPLIAIVKLLGGDYKDIRYYSQMHRTNEVDIFTKIDIVYTNAIATAKVGLGVKSEGELVISGTKGYIYVPAPWWKTEHFETRFEKSKHNRKYFYKFDGDGLRYEIAEFLRLINGSYLEGYKLRRKETIDIIDIIEKYNNKENVIELI